MMSTSMVNIERPQNGYDGTHASCTIELMPATAMPNQRAHWLPCIRANAASTWTMPTISRIHPHVRRSLKT